MNYTEAMAYLAEAGKRGSIPGLDAVRNLLEYLGNPQRQLKFVHIAGTNGKGSTTAMLSSIASAAGLIAGRYTSPAVFDDREKYAVNGQWITEEEYAGCMETVADAVSRMQRDGLTPPTSFEIETALAMVHFVRRGCDIVMLETGMGGALDATNIVDTTVLCVLTAIGMDHVKFLGDTIEEIAAHKAGIIKPGCAVVLEKQSDAVQKVVENVCRENRAALTVTEPENVRLLHSSAAGQRFIYRSLTCEIPLAGKFQLDNAAAAIDSALALRKMGFPISDEAIVRGLKDVSWPGRMQKLWDTPEIFIDGAHNPNAAARLAELIPLLWPNRRLICIMGVLADKDFAQVAEMVCSRAERVITVTPDSPRALDAKALAETVSHVCPHAEAAHDVPDALRRAMAYAQKDDVLLAFGSLSYLKHVANEVRRWN